MGKDKMKKKLDMSFNYKDILGYFIVYGVLILFMCPVMYNIAPFHLFIVYITNLDQIIASGINEIFQKQSIIE